MAEKIASIQPENQRGMAEFAINAGAEVTKHARSRLPAHQRGILERLLPQKAKITIANVALAASVLVSAGCGNSGISEIRVPHIPGFEIEHISKITPTPTFEPATPQSAFTTPEITATSTPSPKPADTSTPTPTETTKPQSTSTMLPTKTFAPTFTPTPDKTIPTELPKDILSKEELEDKYHVRIFNTPNIEFMVRRGALDYDPIFQWLQFKDKATLEHKEPAVAPGNDEVERRNWQAPRHLNVFLIDGPIVHPKFFSEEIKAQMNPKLLKVIEDNIRTKEQEARQNFIKNKGDMLEMQKIRLEWLEENKKSGIIDDVIFNAEKEFLAEMLRPYLNGPTDEDVYNSLTHTLGMFAQPYPQEFIKPDGTRAVELSASVFIAVGTPEQSSTGKTVVSGNRTVSFSGLGHSGIPLRSNQSHPQPEQFTMTADEVYPLVSVDPDKTGTLGQTIRHEFWHIVAGHPQTDKLTYESIRRAAEAFRNGDDSQYYFVLKKRGQDGGPDQILITKQEPSVDSDLNL